MGAEFLVALPSEQLQEVLVTNTELKVGELRSDKVIADETSQDRSAVDFECRSLEEDVACFLVVLSIEEHERSVGDGNRERRAQARTHLAHFKWSNGSAVGLRVDVVAELSWQPTEVEMLVETESLATDHPLCFTESAQESTVSHGNLQLTQFHCLSQVDCSGVTDQVTASDNDILSK